MKNWKRLIFLTEILASIVLAGMIILGFMNIVFRYFLGFSIAANSELLIVGITTLTFLGGALAEKDNKHVGFEAIKSMTKGKIKLIFEICKYTSCSLFILILLYYSFLNARSAFFRGQMQRALGVPTWIFSSIITFSLLLFFIITIGSFVKWLLKDYT